MLGKGPLRFDQELVGDVDEARRIDMAIEQVILNADGFEETVLPPEDVVQHPARHASPTVDLGQPYRKEFPVGFVEKGLSPFRVLPSFPSSANRNPKPGGPKREKASLSRFKNRQLSQTRETHRSRRSPRINCMLAHCSLVIECFFHPT